MNLINGIELNTWRTGNKLTLNEVGDLLGEVTGPTVSRWENGQDIPGPVQKLLAWLIKGIEPFDRTTAPQHVKDALWRVEMSLGAWERLEAMRTLAGYGSLSDWIAAMLREELQAQEAAATAANVVPLASAVPETLKAAEDGTRGVPELRKNVRYVKPKRTAKAE